VNMGQAGPPGGDLRQISERFGFLRSCQRPPSCVVCGDAGELFRQDAVSASLA
jgi:hypothetical protein